MTAPSTPLRALLIEDSELDAGLLLRELRRGGYAITSRRVQTAAELQAALGESAWDIVLSDYKLPRFDGLEALALVRASGLDLPFILVSGAAGEEVAVAAMRAGAADYFVKGRLATLAPAVARELREAADRRARKESEEQVRKLYHAVEQAPVSLMITDLDGRIEYVNPQFTETTGYRFAEVKGQNPRLLKSGLVPPGVYEELWRTITSGGEWRGELQNRARDGRLYWEFLSISPIRGPDGRTTHYLSATLDITARKLADQKIREQADLIDKANEAIVATDLDGRITFWSRGAERLFGRTSDDAVGRLAIETFPTSVVSDGPDLPTLLSSSDDWRGEVRARTAGDTPLFIETSVTVLRDATGQPTGRLSISTDITEKKKLAERFLRAQRMESIGMLAAGIAHDLNNVLAPIGMASSLLRPRLTEPGDLRLLDTLEKCALRGSGLIRQILGFAHGIGGEPRLSQVRHLLRDIVDVINETFPKSIVVEEEIDRDLWPILANPTQIHQVLLNLSVNARDAMPQGGTLRIEARNLVLDEAGAAALEDGRPGSWAVLTIADTGTGMSPEVLARIWEPFFTTKSADRGTGLGLSTVRGIIETHHGFLTVKSEPGRGTVFTVYLPAAESALAEPPAPLPTGAARGHGELILFVDDEELIREAAGGILTHAGYRLLTAVDGAEAAALFPARAAEIALVITDRDMPTLDGAGLAEVVRACRPDLKILAISGLGKSTLGARGGTEFADAFVPKPFSADTLLHAVEQLLQNKPARAPETIHPPADA